MAATTLIMPVVKIDQPVANGSSCSIALALRRDFFDIAEKSRAVLTTVRRSEGKAVTWLKGSCHVKPNKNICAAACKCRGW